MAGGYLRVAGVLRGIGGRVIVHGASQDICIACSSHWPVMRVTSWRVSLEAVDESGGGVTSVLASSSVDEGAVSSSLELADLTDVVEEDEDPFSSSVVDVGLGLFDCPVIVLTNVVTTFVLVWLPDASEILIAVIVLTNVVTTSVLDWFLDVPGTVVVDVLLARMLDLKAVEVVTLPLPADVVMLVVELLRLDAELMLVVVELKSAVLEVDAVEDEIEEEVLRAEVEVVNFGSEDDVERETAVVFMPVL